MVHTPGPWYSVNYGGYISIQNVDGYDDNDLLNEEKCPDAEANGKLAAAAPDLLQLIQWITKVTNSPEIGIKCDAAIKKATE